MYYCMLFFQHTKLFWKIIGVSLSWDNEHYLYFNALVLFFTIKCILAFVNFLHNVIFCVNSNHFEVNLIT